MRPEADGGGAIDVDASGTMQSRPVVIQGECLYCITTVTRVCVCTATLPYFSCCKQINFLEIFAPEVIECCAVSCRPTWWLQKGQHLSMVMVKYCFSIKPK